MIDTTPPDTTIDSNPPELDDFIFGSFSFSGTDGGTGVASFQCSLNGGSFAGCASPKSYSDFFYGPNTFRVRAIDAAGNVDPTPASYTWEVLFSLPQTSIDAGGSITDGMSSSSDAAFLSNYSFGAGVSTFQCKLDAGAFESCPAFKFYSGLADGSHTFQAYAVDENGNADPTPASFTWVIDTTPPDTTIDSKPSDPSSSSDADFGFGGSDGGTGVASFECRLDGGGFTACTNPQNHSSLSESSHTFQVRAIDAVGNVDPTPASFTWTVDTGIWHNDDVITYTQGGWGSSCPAIDPLLDPRIGCVRDAFFDWVYPTGAMVGTPGGSMTFTSSAALEAYLPAGGTINGVGLTEDLVNPTTTNMGVFAGNLLALQLNIDFNNAAIDNPAPGMRAQHVRFSDLTLCGFDALPDVNGVSVGELLADANIRLGGGTPSLAISISQEHVLITSLNTDYFLDGIPSEFAEDHLRPSDCPSPE